MYANNETGAIFPVEEIAAKVKEINPDTKIFVDAVQAAGKIPVNVKDTKIDFMGISAHKFHGPKRNWRPLCETGYNGISTHYRRPSGKRQRAGTENVPYIVGMAEATKLAMDNMQDELTRVKRLRDTLEEGILSKIKMQD